MNMQCVYYIEGTHPTEIPEGQEYDGLRYKICGWDAPYMVNGSSYCREHVKIALGRTAIKVGHKTVNQVCMECLTSRQVNADGLCARCAT